MVSHEFESTVGDDFVGVHVGRRARTTLNHVDREILVMLPVKYFAAGRDDRVRLFIGEKPELMIGHCSTHLCDGQPVDE